MREVLLTLSFFMLSCMLDAQSLYTTTSIGGKGGGTITELDRSANTLKLSFAFDTEDGGYTAWHSRLVVAADGKLYGTTYGGGSYRNGTIFSYNPATAKYTKLYDFDFQNGGQPSGSLMQASDGKLYGMTNNNGSYGRGTIFSFNPANSTYTKLFDFNNTNGEFPRGSLIEALDGKLYGMTSNGGTNNYGVIFSYDRNTGVYTKLKDFDGINGSFPTSDFMQTPDGTLYATAFGGGKNNLGTIFSFNPATSALVKLKDLDNANGCNPYSSFIRAANGKFYSMTTAGGNNNLGVMFSYDPATQAYEKLLDFDYTLGARPWGNLEPTANGKLYGMTSGGGAYYRGVLFSYDIATAAYSKLEDFNDVDGTGPYGSVAIASDGKLYGGTYAGGKGNRGILFSYNPGNGVFTNIRDFGINATGSLVYGGVVKIASGKLYGMTFSGGNFALGTIFSFDPSTSTYTKVLDFNGSNGASPYGSLVLASDGKLYGMTSNGGTNNAGVVFSFDPVTANCQKLKDLDYVNGGFPYGHLVQATNGKLYGMAWAGGKNGMGSIFSLDPVTNGYTKILDFDGTNGAYPISSFLQAKNGKLYAATYNGGVNDWGVLFSLDPVTGVYKKFKEFNTASGTNPSGTLTESASGKLYGMASYGVWGTIFSYDTSNNLVTKIKAFNYFDGAIPKGSLVTGSDSLFYGVTTDGGVYGNGVAFSFDPVSSNYTVLQDFDGTNGKAPTYTFFTETDLTQRAGVAVCPGGNTSLTSIISGTVYRWQVNTGSNFVDITDNENYSRTETVSLQLTNLPSSWYGYTYRCVADGNNGDVYTIKFVNTWTGNAGSNWENPANWSCGTVPDGNTDVIIKTGSVILNSNASVRSFKVAASANFTVHPGYTLNINH